MDWLLISSIITGVGALILAFVLGAFWLADRSDRQAERIIRDIADESERVILHGEHPWNLKQ